MFAFQFERSQIVIELRWLPGIGRVARTAVRAEAAEMRVVLSMARETILRRRGEIGHSTRVGVTGNAIYVRVFSIQQEWEGFM
jgi:hypothetical protein